MKIGDILICKKSLYLYYAGVVGDIEYGMRENKKYEINDLHHDEISIKVELGFCIWFTKSNAKHYHSQIQSRDLCSFRKLKDHFYTIKEIRKLKLNKIYDKQMAIS